MSRFRDAARPPSLLANLQAQIAALSLPPHARDAEIHAVRKKLKRLRASLRLLRASIGDGAYRRHNTQLRDAGAMLAPMRDAKSVTKAFGKLERPAGEPEMERYFTAVRRILDDERLALRKRFTRALCRRFSARLASAAVQLKRARISRPELQSAAIGLHHGYRLASRAMRRAKHDAADGVWHEWRKQVKYQLNELALTEGIFGARFKKFSERADKLAGLLGSHHDLAIVERKLLQLQLPVPGALAKRLRQRQRRSRRMALSIGHRLFGHPPGRFQASMQRNFARAIDV